MKKFVFMLFCAISIVSLHAGDVATFVNLGFSSDGIRFVFGQYGVTDSDFYAYADIFCVDVVKNVFIPDGNVSTVPSSVTKEKEGKGVFAALQNGSAPVIKKLGIDSAIQGRALYIQAENEPLQKNISFRDFETGSRYEITVNTLVEGTGKSVQSSFYLTVNILNADGKTIIKTVGLPGYMREGVKNYLVRRIITDSTGKSLVFIIEKDLYNTKGTSIRYMVETVRL